MPPFLPRCLCASVSLWFMKVSELEEKRRRRCALPAHSLWEPAVTPRPFAKRLGLRQPPAALRKTVPTRNQTPRTFPFPRAPSKRQRMGAVQDLADFLTRRGPQNALGRSGRRRAATNTWHPPGSAVVSAFHPATRAAVDWGRKAAFARGQPPAAARRRGIRAAGGFLRRGNRRSLQNPFGSSAASRRGFVS